MMRQDFDHKIVGHLFMLGLYDTTAHGLVYVLGCNSTPVCAVWLWPPVKLRCD